MFLLLGRTVARFWPAVIVAWVLFLGLSWCCTPGWDAVTGQTESAPLPADAPSQRAAHFFREAFPAGYSGGNIVLVVWRRQGTLSDADEDFIDDGLSARLWHLAEDQPSLVKNIRTLGEPGAGALLVSPDRAATLIVLELSTPFTTRQNWPLVDQVEEVIASLRRDGKLPEGLDIAITGSAPASRDLARAELQSAHAVEVWTIIMVVGLLLLLYRAPLVALIPLVTVYFAVEIALGLMSVLVGAGWLNTDREARIFITVLVYGAGVDYCLFLIARFREELDGGSDPAGAIARAVGHVGTAICVSAATVIGGIAMLAFAHFEKIHQAGLAIPIALLIVLAATLTFTAALLRLAGRWAFWPSALARLPGLRLPDLWDRLGTALLRRPGTIWLASVAAMLPFVVVGLLHYTDQNYNPISELPASTPSARGAGVLEEHFPPGVAGTVTVLLHDERRDFRRKEGIDLVEQLTDRLRDHRDELKLADVRSVARPLGITPAAKKAVEDLPIPAGAVASTLRRRAVAHYVSQAGPWRGHVTRIDLELAQGPFSRQAIRDLERIEAFLRAELPAGLAGARIEVDGATAIARDLAAIKENDQRRIEMLVPAVVLVLLLLLLRRAAVSVYLVASVLFSYLATMGATFVFFWLLDPQGFSGLDWKVPIFLFTILVAVGEDYNIFLVTRIREEQQRQGPLEGVRVAQARTGRVISSCGFLMAGTFAALLSGSLLAMKQLGFALALGILLDTLVVRPILVPAFLVLLQNGSLGRIGRRLALHREPDHGPAENGGVPGATVPGEPVGAIRR